MKLQNHVSRMIVYYEWLILQYPGHKVNIENTMSETEKRFGGLQKDGHRLHDRFGGALQG